MKAVDQDKLAPSISMVPIQLRGVKKEAYRPQMVTIGSYHHGNLHLLRMEKHKRHYMQALLCRVQNPVETLDDCGKAIKNLDQRVRECYADRIRFDATELGKILMVDGCFILGLFYRHIIQQHTSNSNDPNVANAWMVPTLRHDLELLENQIPFFILVELYNIFQKQHIFSGYSLTSLALSFFHPNVNVNQEGMSMEPNHLLDLLHKSLLPTLANDSSCSPPSNDSSGSETWGFELCASQLLEAGIQFERISESHLLDIKFDSGNGVIKIPPLSIHKTELLLRNLIALEHCGFQNSCKTFHISSYALMMRSLIRSLADVELLEEKGIITSNSVGSGRILGLIDDICKNVDIKDFYFLELCKEVNAYCKSRTCRMGKKLETDWLFPLKEKLSLLVPTLPTPSISKVPRKLRKVDKEAYSPQMVSIGPYHYGNLDLLGMEEHKMQYMRNLLRRGENDSVKTLDDCGKAIKNLDLRVRECYADKIRFESFDATKLGEILLVDGCFIIELFYKHVIQQENDPIANNAWMVSARQHDLVLLENQIPFFILVELYNIFHRRLNIPPEHSLISLAVSFFNLKMNVRQEALPTEPNHLLDLLHKCLLPAPGSDSTTGNPPSNESSSSETRGFDLCASELLKAGIQFKKNESHLLDIKFDSVSEVIKIPSLSVDATKSLLRNLIALEQCGFSNSCKTFHISSYALLMRSLINSSADIELLQEKGIITPDSEGIGSILGLINDICKNVHVRDFYFSELCKEVNAYIKSRMPGEIEANWLLPLKEKLDPLSPILSTPRISKIPNKLQKVDKEAYSPQMVSIGPYHHGNLDLLGMEDYKMHCMRNLLCRGENDPVETLNDCGKAIKNLVLRVRECYADKTSSESFDATKLGGILLVDACFIIELFYRHVIQHDSNLNDPIANDAWMVSAFQHDLVLLENQIPFFILVELYEIFHRRLNISPEHSLTSLTVSFFNIKLNVRQEVMSTEPNHLLDLLHNCLLPTSGSDASGSPPSNDSSGSKTQGFHLCASKLSKAGIQFKKNESHLLDIKFDEDKAVIKIPSFSVGATKSLLRNLIALEQCGFSNSCNTYHISSYALMMRSLIRSSADVQLLEEKGIITSDLEGSESVLDLINDVCKNVHIKHFYFRELCNEVNACIKSRRMKAVELLTGCFCLKRKRS